MKNNKALRYLFMSLLLIAGISRVVAADSTYFLSSPNGKLTVEVRAGGQLTYSVRHEDKTILSHSNIGLALEDGTIIGKDPRITGVAKKRITDDVDAPFYRSKKFVASCNELILKLKDGFGVAFRAYDEGVAYRFYTTRKGETTIQNEIADFCFDKDYTAYLPHSTNKKEPLAMAFQGLYEAKPLSQASKQLAFLPATVDYGGGLKLTILESDLEAYPGMFVQAESGRLKGVFAPLPVETAYYPSRKQQYVTKRETAIARTKGARPYPWRVLAITEKDTDMPVNNLVYALASPNRIGDYSWVETGKVAWEWWNDWGLKGVDFKAGINMDTYKHYIDFASRNGIEFVVLDEGWYEPKSGDMLTVIPALNLPELIAYGRSKGVGIILWTVFNVLDDQLQAACEKYAAMGAKGFKVDFLDRDDQTAVEMVCRIAEATAKHKLTLDLHGIYKPTGLNRTYPHIINFESVFGMEEVKWSTPDKDMPLYDVTFPYIRMMAGPVDYTPGAMRNGTKADWKAIYTNPVSMGTRCHQLAAYIVHDSPLTMLCDAPTNYSTEQECVDFITSVPCDVDETRILSGVMGESIVTARRKDINWYIGGMTNWTERDIELDFSFLGEGEVYRATLFKDGANANKQAADYKKETFIVTRDSGQKIHLAPGGGFVLKLERTVADEACSTAVATDADIPVLYQKCLL